MTIRFLLHVYLNSWQGAKKSKVSKIEYFYQIQQKMQVYLLLIRLSQKSKYFSPKKTAHFATETFPLTFFVNSLHYKPYLFYTGPQNPQILFRIYSCLQQFSMEQGYRSYDYEQTAASQCSNDDLRHCQQYEIENQFANMKISSNISSRYTSYTEYRFVDLGKLPIPLFVQKPKRKLFRIESSIKRDLEEKTFKTTTIIKVWKKILREAVQHFRGEFEWDEYNMLACFLGSLDYTPDKFREILGLTKIVGDNDKPFWTEKDEYDKIRITLLRIVGSRVFLGIVLKSRGTWSEKAQLVSSLRALQEFIINPFEEIRIT